MTIYLCGATFTGGSNFRAAIQRWIASASQHVVVGAVGIGAKMLRQDIDEIKDILERLSIVLLGFASNKGPEASSLRKAVGYLHANVSTLAASGTLSGPLLACFTTAVDAGINVDTLDHVIDHLFQETPSEGASLLVVQTCILFALAQESRIVAGMEFVSRDDVDVMMTRMKSQFDAAKELAADAMESNTYSALLDLATALIRHLADTARPLPRMSTFNLAPLPALAASNFIYGDGSRWEDLVAENKIVHPAFLPASLRALNE